MKTIIRKLKRFFVMLKADRELQKAIREADLKFAKYGRRYYVLPNNKHRLMVLSFSQIKKMRQAGMFSNKVNEYSVIEESFYFTPNKWGEPLSAKRKNIKRKMWLNYMAQAKKL